MTARRPADLRRRLRGAVGPLARAVGRLLTAAVRATGARAEVDWSPRIRVELPASHGGVRIVRDVARGGLLLAVVDPDLGAATAAALDAIRRARDGGAVAPTLLVHACPGVAGLPARLRLLDAIRTRGLTGIVTIRCGLDVEVPVVFGARTAVFVDARSGATRATFLAAMAANAIASGVDVGWSAGPGAPPGATILDDAGHDAMPAFVAAALRDAASAPAPTRPRVLLAARPADDERALRERLSTAGPDVHRVELPSALDAVARRAVLGTLEAIDPCAALCRDARHAAALKSVRPDLPVVLWTGDARGLDFAGPLGPDLIVATDARTCARLARSRDPAVRARRHATPLPDSAASMDRAAATLADLLAAVLAATDADAARPGHRIRTFTIRPVLARDVAALELHWRAARPSRHRTYERLHRRGTVSSLVVWEGDRPVGAGSIRWAGPRDGAAARAHPACPELLGGGVAAELRSRGLGARLIRALETLARAAGHREVGMAVASDNPAARRLYERLGYRPADVPEFVDRFHEPGPDGEKRWIEVRCAFLVHRLGH